MERKVCELVSEVEVKADEEAQEERLVDYFASATPVPIGQRVCQ